MTNKSKMVGCRITENMYKQLDSMEGSISKNILKALELYIKYNTEKNSKNLVDLALKEKKLEDLNTEALKLASEVKMIRLENHLEDSFDVNQALKKSYYLDMKQKFLKNELDRINKRNLTPEELKNKDNVLQVHKEFLGFLEHNLKQFNIKHNSNISYNEFIKDLINLKHEIETNETENRLNEEIKHLKKNK